MRAKDEAFDRVWDAHLQGAEPIVSSPEMAELVAVARAMGSWDEAVDSPSTDQAWAWLSAELDRPVVPLRTLARPAAQQRPALRLVPPAIRPRWRRAALRWTSVAAAMFAALALMSLHAEPGSALYPVRTSLERTALFVWPDNAGLHLSIAEARLGDLLHVLRVGPQQDAPAVARALVAQRDAAAAAGDDVGGLDARIRSEVPDALRGGVEIGIARRVARILDLNVVLVAPTPPSVESTDTGGSTNMFESQGGGGGGSQLPGPAGTSQHARGTLGGGGQAPGGTKTAGSTGLGVGPQAGHVPNVPGQDETKQGHQAGSPDEGTGDSGDLPTSGNLPGALKGHSVGHGLPGSSGRAHSGHTASGNGHDGDADSRH